MRCAAAQVIDYGFPQSSSSEALKEFVLNEPIIVRAPVRALLLLPEICPPPLLRRHLSRQNHNRTASEIEYGVDVSNI